MDADIIVVGRRVLDDEDLWGARWVAPSKYHETC
jgi:hypothetical protein